jgi:hypothetical protein
VVFFFNWEDGEEFLPRPSGVTAPRPVTTTLRIAFYDEVDDVGWENGCMDSR